MNGQFSQDQLPAHELQRLQQQRRVQHSQAMAQNQAQQMAEMINRMGQQQPNNMMGPVPLADITQRGQDGVNRRSSLPDTFTDPTAADQAQRRMSGVVFPNMMQFGPGDDNMGHYAFNDSLPGGFSNMGTNGFNINEGLGNYIPGGVGDGYGPTMSQDMMGNLIPSTFANLNMNQFNTNSPSMPVFPNVTLASEYPTNHLSSMANDYGATAMNPTDEASMPAVGDNSSSGQSIGTLEKGGDNDMMNLTSLNALDSAMDDTPNPSTASITNMDTTMGTQSGAMPTPLSRQLSSSGSGVSPQQGGSAETNTTQPSASDAPTPATPSIPPGGQRPPPKGKAIYSKSGFDMLKALWLVATRKNPKINLGAVDMSCAFVVCDVTLNDCPIIYVSDNFQNLTGYSQHDIMGQNCRFLQAPNGKVEAGSKREFVDDGAVFNLKKMIHEGREVQQSLINYRKGGKPFLNLLTMIPIPWDTDAIRYFIGFQIDLVECPDAIASGQELGAVQVNYKHSDIGQYIWTPPNSSQWDSENGQTLGVDDVSTLLQQYNPKGVVSDWHKQSWDKMLLENADDVVHVLSLKGLFLYLSPACKRTLEYDPSDLVGNSLSSVCHPSDIVPVTRELKDATAGNQVNIVFRIRRKNSGYTWFESHGSLFVEQGKGRKCIILVGRKRPVFTLARHKVESFGGIGDSELWTKLSTSGMFLFVSSNIRSLLDLQPEALVGTSIQDLMRKESRPEFGRAVEKARRGRIVQAKHEVQNRRGQVLQAQTTLYPGDASEGQKPSFLLAQTKLLKASSRGMAGSRSEKAMSTGGRSNNTGGIPYDGGQVSQPAGGSMALGSQDEALASEDNIFDELRTTKCSSWQFELRQMEKVNRILAEELGGLLSNRKKRKRRKGVGNVVRDCANCHTRNTPEWRRGPSGQRDLCNSCGLRWAKQVGRVSPRNSSRGGNGGHGDSNSKKSASPNGLSPLHKEMTSDKQNSHVSGSGSIPNTPGGGGSTVRPHDPATAPSGAASAVGQKQAGGMPPLSLSGAPTVIPNSMTSIQEEREGSQL